MEEIEFDRPDYKKYPALQYAEGYRVILQPGETLFIPSAYWHYMRYLTPSISMTLRAFPTSLKKRLKLIKNVVFMMNYDNLMRKLRGQKWIDYKNRITIENTNKNHPYKLVTAPAHNFLNSSFTEIETSRNKEIKPTIKIHPSDLKTLKCKNNDIVIIGNKRGKIRIHVEEFSGILPGTTVVEGIWPNEYFLDDLGINTLVGADSPEPAGGAVFHDVAIWIKALN